MKIRRKMRHKRSYGAIWVFCTVLTVCGILIYGTVQSALAVTESWLQDLPSVEDSDSLNYARKTRVYAADGTTLLAELYAENREPITIDQVSDLVLEGTVATEDERFYEHDGVDFPGIARAVVVNMSSGKLEGASTITQQFVRNTLLTDEAHEITLERKLREAQLALDLEDLYSKDEILMLYLNTINYGDGAYGIEAAALNYFQKHTIDLNISEAATLIALPQSPNELNPKEYPEAALARRDLVLERMLKRGTITQEEYDTACEEPLNLNPAPPAPLHGIYAYPYFTSYVRDILHDHFDVAEIFKGGLTVYTTLDPSIQNMAEIAASEQYAVMADDIEVSLTSIDPKTGYIKAMVGGRDYQADQWNVATQGLRHAGSSFKTFTLITAIEQGLSPQTPLDCSSPIVMPDWRVENYGGASYGTRTIQNATAISSNTGYVRLMQRVTPEAIYETARRMGITSPDLEPWPSATLGAVGVSSLEMASAYSVLAAEGVRREPVAITQVIDRNGETIFLHEDTSQRVLTEDVAYATTKVLQTVFTEGTATAARLGSGQPAAGKTGTSENWRDSWLCAYTPQLSTAVWMGARQERTLPESLDCSRVWRSFMGMALEGQPIEPFAVKNDPPYLQQHRPPTPTEKPDISLSDETGAPTTLGMTLDQAAEALYEYDAEYVEEYSDTVPAGQVIRETVVDGVIRLYVSLGPRPQ